MFCPYCGIKVSDQASFCGNCGSSLRKKTAPAAVPVETVPCEAVPVETVPVVPAPVEAAPVVTAPAPVKAESVTWESHFLKRWKKFALSPLALLLVLCVTLVQVLGAISNPAADFAEMMNSLGLSALCPDDAMRAITVSMNATWLASLVPGILTALALWMLLFTALKGGPKLNTTGMTIIQVLQIIGLVGICLLFGALVLVLVISLIGASGYSDGPQIILGIALGVVAAIGAFSIFTCAMILRLIKSVKTTMTTFVPTCKGAMFVGVMSIIGGVFSSLVALVSPSLVSVLGAATAILYGALAISYRDFVAELADVRSRMV